MTAPSPAYRLLARCTVAVTFLLIVLGGIVRVSDSGLGCGKAHSGIHGWPLCQGDVVPGVSLHAVIEYCHRITAAVVVVLMAALAIQAWRRYRGYRAIVAAATAASLLVIAQALLGAATVDQDLNETLVASHLGLAMLLFALVIYIARAAQPGVAGAAPVDGGPGFRVTAVISQTILFVAIVAGGYMAGTEHFGRTGNTGLGAHEACGKEFPGCAHAGVLPFGSTRLVNIQLAHRLAVYLTVIAVAAVIFMILETQAHAADAKAGVRPGRAAGGPVRAGRAERGARRLRGADRRPPDGGEPALGHDDRGHDPGLPRAGTRAREGAFAPPRAGGHLMEAGTRTREELRAALVASRAGSFRQLASDYLELTKPKVQSLLLFTTVTTMYVAGTPSLGLVLLTCLGGALSAGGAGAINHAYDRDIDASMKRTAMRPVPSGRVSPAAAVRFGVALGIASFTLLALTVNVLAAALALSGLLGYVLVYTVWLKRRTPQNIVIGGAAGAVPPLVAWAATRGTLDGSALYLFAIVFYWTPPHFWALSLLMKDEYASAGVPMLPVVRGEAETRWQILLYTILLVTVTLLPFAFGLFGGIYLVAALILGSAFTWMALRLRERADKRSALRLYLFSLAYLALLFAAMVADARL